MVKIPPSQSKRRPSPYERTKDHLEMDGESTDRVITVQKNYCSFCGGKAAKRHECVQCRAIVCEQDFLDDKGCIGFGTVSNLVPFLCLLCEQTAWKRSPQPTLNPACGFLGYGERKHMRLNWPLVVVSLQLAGETDTFIRDAITLDVKHLGNDNVSVLAWNGSSLLSCETQSRMVCALLKKSGQVVAQKEMIEGWKFIQDSIERGMPANTFVVVDTHAETDTGRLQYGGGKTQPDFARTSEVIDGYCGEVMLKTMEAANLSAQQHSASEASHWFNDSVYFRGGWRVLLLATCGQTFRVENGLIDVKRLVERCVLHITPKGGDEKGLQGHIRFGAWV
ncbi:hypothetical protein J3R83DRAFT_10941 [Lanmaoa asiatica]|nr:hypothetical protein J3R83DRAFT_10941 [Lanmaoa asiatica]